MLGVPSPVWLGVDIAATALRAIEPPAKLGDGHVVGVPGHVNIGAMPAVRPVASGHMGADIWRRFLNL